MKKIKNFFGKLNCVDVRSQRYLQNEEREALREYMRKNRLRGGLIERVERNERIGAARLAR